MCSTNFKFYDLCSYVFGLALVIETRLTPGWAMTHFLKKLSWVNVDMIIAESFMIFLLVSIFRGLCNKTVTRELMPKGKAQYD